MPLQKQVIDLPLGGLDTKRDSHAIEPPGLAVLKDGQFDDVGAIQTREQYQDILDSAGNTISDIRKIAQYGDELIAFSKDKLWSYSKGDGSWEERDEYLAVSTEEQARFVTTADQYDCDRVEKDGIAVYTWNEDSPVGTRSYVAALDVETGAVRLSPQDIYTSGSVYATQPRLLETDTHVAIVYYTSDNAEIGIRFIDPSDLTSTSVSYAKASVVSMDAIQNPDTPADVIVVAFTGTTSYELIRSVSRATPVTIATVIQTVDDCIALDYDTVNDLIVVIRNAGTSMRMDRVTIGGTISSSNTVIGTAGTTPVNQISVNCDNVNTYNVYFTAGQAVDETGFSTNIASVNATTLSVGSAQLIDRCSIVTKAFAHDGASYIWIAFAAENQGELSAQLQNGYFLVRADGVICAKAVASQAGGFRQVAGNLATVRNLSGNRYAWAGLYRRIVPLGKNQKGYAAKSLQDIVFEFDSNDARRTAHLGDTLYISGGFLSQYDGRSITEVGFHYFPFYLDALQQSGSSNLSGEYSWKQTFSWYNAKGELDRSTTASITTEGPFGSPTQEALLNLSSLSLTAKSGPSGEVAIEIWRTTAAATPFSPFYLVTSKDPSATGLNRYIENDPAAYFPTTFQDGIGDTDLIGLETDPENGGATLASLAPPPATVIHATQDRIILAGIPGNPNRVVYSKLRGSGEVAAFNDYLSVDLPPGGGAITAIGFLNETLIVFKKSSVYALPGDGYDNNGGGQNYGPARILSSDAGAVSAEGVTLTPKGILFKSEKGWYLLNQGWSASYVGGPVEDFDGDTVSSAHTIEDQHQVRIVTSSRILLWDYLVDQWSEWTVDTVGGCMWDGEHHIVAPSEDTLLVQGATHGGVIVDPTVDSPALDLETGWIRFGSLQGFQRIRRFYVLGKYRGSHRLRIRVAYNYDENDAGVTWTDDKYWTPSAAKSSRTLAQGDALQVEHHCTIQKCESVKIRITAESASTDEDPPDSYALDISGLTLWVGVKPTGYKGLRATGKQ